MMRKFMHTVILSLTLLTLSSFVATKKSDFKFFAGTWKDLDHPNNSFVFTAEGTFYNISNEGSLQVITHSGNYKILPDHKYMVNITFARPNAKYSLLGKTYTNNYIIDRDKNSLKLTGTVEGSEGKSSLNWSNNLVRIEKLGD